MGIKPLTTKDEIYEYLMNKVRQKEELIIRRFCYIGERCIIEARSTDSYKDRTGNLRNSIGYTVLMDGKIKEHAIVDSRKGTDRENGAAEANKLIEKLVDKYSNGIVLIVFAGMKYAAHVSAKGYDVLDSAELLADQLVPKLLKEMGFKA